MPMALAEKILFQVAVAEEMKKGMKEYVSVITIFE